MNLIASLCNFITNVQNRANKYNNFRMNISFINYNEFLTTGLFKNNYIFPKAHIRLEWSKNLKLKGNVFANTIEYSPFLPDDLVYTADKRGKGIESLLSSFIVTPVYTFDYHSFPSGTENKFSGLYYAIDARGQKTYAPQIHHCEFTNNFRGIHLKATNGARVLYNKIYTTEDNLTVDAIGYSNVDTPNGNVTYATYLNGAKNTWFEENKIFNGMAGAYVYNSDDNGGTRYYRNDFGGEIINGVINNKGMNAASIVVGKNSNWNAANPPVYITGLEVRCNDYTGNGYAISAINGNMRKNQGVQDGQTDELAGNQFHGTYSPAMDFKVQIQTGSFWNFSGFDLGKYNYWQHENNETLDYYTQLDNYTELKIQTHTLDVFNPLNSCLSNYPGPFIIDTEFELSRISTFKNTMTDKENQYNDLVDRGDTENLINLTESMSNRNFNSIFPILCNDGYISDEVFETILDNRSTNRPRIASILIENSPLPENIMELVESSDYLQNGHKKQIRRVQSGTSPRLEFEYEIADIKQEISKIESNLINHAIDNDSVPELRETVINYLINDAEENSINYVNRFNLQLAQTELTEAQNTLNDLRIYASGLSNEDMASEIQRFCDVHDIYISILQDTVFDNALLVQNQEFLKEAALDFSPLYSGKAQTLYELATDSVFIERRITK